MGDASTTRSRRLAWVLLLAALVSLRLPSLVQPAGGDQGLYVYAGRQWLEGSVPYRDLWDQKPPGVAFIYAALSAVWPHESVVSAADILASAATAWLLVVIGRRRFSESIGFGAAAIFLLFGDPSLHRLSGVYVRGQCEPFIALAVTGAIAILAGSRRTRATLLAAGACLAAAVWLKYNAITYALPALAALWVWPIEKRSRASFFARDTLTVGTGALVVAAAVLVYFAVHGALKDFWLATIEYNLRYSNETYEGASSVPAYLATFPFARARVDMLWFLGGSGLVLMLWRRPADAPVVFAWLAAAALSITINGQRDLPNYFVQANPALGLAAAVGYSAAMSSTLVPRIVAAGLILVGLWRVGDEGPRGSVRWAGLPGLFENVRFDVDHARGAVDRATYLARFRGVKFDAAEIATVSQYVRANTQTGDPIYVFGFLGGSISWLSDRVSASRFFWSRPVLIEFAADEPGYGSKGLLAELERRPPALVALQEEQWGSRTFFLTNPDLSRWLRGGYELDRETTMFQLWVKKR